MGPYMLKVFSGNVIGLRRAAARSNTIGLATTAGLCLILHPVFDILPLLQIVLLPALNGLQCVFYLAGRQGHLHLYMGLRQ